VKITSPLVTLLAGAALMAGVYAADLHLAPAKPARAGLAAAQPSATPGAASSGKATTPPAKATTPPAKATTPPAKAGKNPPTPPAHTLVAVRGTAHLKGNKNDWTSSATMVSAVTVSGHDTGITASWQMMWDNTNLYLRATVHDPQIVQPFVANPGQLFRGDSVSFELGPNAATLSNGAPLRSGDAHYLFGPRPGGGLITAVNHAQGGSFVDGRADSRIKTFEQPLSAGYLVEIAVPWTVIGIAPKPGRALASNLNVSDGSANGVLRDMKSTNARRFSKNQSHPGTWEKLELLG
jgi:Carbohydrate family 9 binding domain-like